MFGTIHKPIKSFYDNRPIEITDIRILLLLKEEGSAIRGTEIQNKLDRKLGKIHHPGTVATTLIHLRSRGFIRESVTSRDKLFILNEITNSGSKILVENRKPIENLTDGEGKGTIPLNEGTGIV